MLYNLVLHGFVDASIREVSAVIYAVVRQKSGTTQGLVDAKSRLIKRNLTIPRHELVAGYMAVNLATKVQLAIDFYPVSVHCWLDYSVALYWIGGHGEYQHQGVKWHHVPSTDNPADLGSLGGDVENHLLLKKGPSWLSQEDTWPPDIILEPNADSNTELLLEVSWQQQHKPVTNLLASCNKFCEYVPGFEDLSQTAETELKTGKADR